MFARTLRHAATLVVALAALAACDASPVAPGVGPSARAASTITTPSDNIISRDVVSMPLSFGMYAACANAGQGDYLAVRGTLEYRGHWITTNGGQRQHNAIVSKLTGSATADASGEVFDILQREVSESNIDYGTDGIPDSGTELQRIRVRLTSRATGAVFDIVLVGRFLQSATGEFVLAGWDGTARCN